MASSAALYTPHVLALATSLAAWPPRPDLPYHGEARSPACGSRLSIALATDEQRVITEMGLSAHACAIGQAAAAIFAQGAVGRDIGQLAAALAGLARWLDGEGAAPDWPGVEAIAAARDYPGRHGAMLLPWKAAVAALSTGEQGR